MKEQDSLCNAGKYSTGVCNSGDYCTGDCNSGNWNTGNKNTGNWNAGNENTGNENSGKCNSGNKNTGKGNSGNCNTGNNNKGDCNTGDWNISNTSNGCFMTKKPTIMMFNKMSNWTYTMWLSSDARYVLEKMPRGGVKWVNDDDMTDKEKSLYPAYKVTGGYLKKLNEPKCVQSWWDNLEDYDKKVVKELPNFDASIFEEITGIKVK